MTPEGPPGKETPMPIQIRTGQPVSLEALGWTAVVDGLATDVDPEKGHTFEPSVVTPGEDRCGRVAGWMTACGQPRVAEIHQPGYLSPSEKADALKNGNRLDMELQGLTRAHCRMCGGPVDLRPGDDPLCSSCWLGTGGDFSMLAPR